MPLPSHTCTEAEVLTDVEALAGTKLSDFSSIDFVAEPWAWISHLMRDKPPRGDVMRDSGAPGVWLIDFRETFSAHYGQEASAKLMRILQKICDEHFSLCAQGLHKRSGFYMARIIHCQFKPPKAYKSPRAT